LLTLTSKPARSSRATTLRKDLTAIRLDGFAWALMSGSAELVAFSTFALRIGTSEVLTGLLATVPMVIGAVVQTVSPWGIARVRSHRRWTIYTALLQATAFFPLMLGAARGHLSAPLLFAAVALYWAAGFSAGASWTALVGVLVPSTIRANYFARRTRLNHLGIFLGLALTGLTLHWSYSGPRPAGSGASPDPLWPFVGIFAASATARAVSCWQLARYSEAPAEALSTTRPRPLQPCAPYAALRNTPAHALLVVLFALMVAAYIASPFYTPFMLKRLHLDYLHFMILVGVVPLAKVATLPLLGRVARRYGARRLLWIAVLAMAPPAGAWALSHNFAWLLVLQTGSGAAWAAYELATFLLVLEYVPEHQRTGLMTSWNLVSALGQATGSFLGGATLAALGSSPDDSGPSLHAYYAIFLASSILRASCALLLPRLARRGPPSASPRGDDHPPGPTYTT
jgi:hypothetical protein